MHPDHVLALRFLAACFVAGATAAYAIDRIRAVIRERPRRQL